MDVDWGWKKLITSVTKFELETTGFPGWDRHENGKMLSIRLSFAFGSGVSSHRVATELDDICERQFHYRDFTKDGIPFETVSNGPYYMSLFLFQSKKDYDKCMWYMSKYPETMERYIVDK